MDNMPVRRIELKAEQHDAPPAENEVGDVVRAIRAGQVVVLPTETVYGLAADPDNATAVARLGELKGRAPAQPFTYHVASGAHISTLAQPPAPRVARLLDRFWPGPLTAILVGRRQPTVGLRVPAHPFTQRVLEHFETGLFLTSVNGHGEPPRQTPDEIAAWSTEIDILVDAGTPALGSASAVVSCTTDELQVHREGILGEEEILRAAAFRVLFACTGNTCRSPLAAASARHRTAAHLGIGEERLLRRGLDVVSAGTYAGYGAPASENSVLAGREIGLDLTTHRSRPLTPGELQDASLAYGMSHSHVARILDLAPGLTHRARLLDPNERDVPDPFGGDLATYRVARDAIDTAVAARVPEIAGLLAS